MKKILIIDDDDIVRNYIVKLLCHEGFEVCSAENGVCGLDEARRMLPDLILCDINMPYLDGYSVLEELRKDATISSIPFIFLSAMEDRAHIRRGMECGADDYLTKPFTIEELLRAVKAQEEKQSMLSKKLQNTMDEFRNNLAMSLPHEMLTPLSGILGASSILLDKEWLLSEKETMEMARIINLSAGRLHHLIQNYVLYTQFCIAENTEHGLERFLKGRVDLMRDSHAYAKALMEGTVTDTGRQNSRSSDLLITIDEGLMKIPEDDIRKIVYELVSNACKFSKQGSHIEVTGLSGPGRYRFSVKDYGIGMKEEQIKSIGAFVQFNRRFYEQQGPGLGLTIARRLTEIYGGEFRIESIPGRGTTVTAILPALNPLDYS